MIPLIIGGVTLAAVGYGIKKYCEEEPCSMDEKRYTHTYSKRTEFDMLNDTKVEMYEYGISSFKEEMLNIENLSSELKLENDVEKFEKESVEKDSSVFDLAKSIAKDSSDVLEKAQAMLLSKLIQISGYIADSKNYNTYTDMQKNTIKSAYSLANSITTICNTNIVNSKNQINSYLINELNKIKIAYDIFESEAFAVKDIYEAKKEKDVFDKLHDTKKELFTCTINSFIDVTTSMKNCELEVKNSDDAFKKELEIENETTKEIAIAIAKSTDEMLQKAELMLNHYTVYLRSLLDENKEFERYEDMNKSVVIKAYELANRITALCYTKIVNSDGSINPQIIKEINNIKTIYEVFEFETNYDEVSKEKEVDPFPSGIVLTRNSNF